MCGTSGGGGHVSRTLPSSVGLYGSRLLVPCKRFSIFSKERQKAGRTYLDSAVGLRPDARGCPYRPFLSRPQAVPKPDDHNNQICPILVNCDKNLSRDVRRKSAVSCAGKLTRAAFQRAHLRLNYPSHTLSTVRSSSRVP